MADVISLSEVQQSFTAFAEAKGASLDVAYADDRVMMARCVLPVAYNVQPGDALKGGVAMRATLEEVEVRPYLLRLVCTNGAIMMTSKAGSSVATAECTDGWLSEAFAAASSDEAIAGAVSEVRTLAGGSFDRTFLMVSLIQRFRGFDNEVVKEMLRRMITDGATGYSLMNAITSVARDTKDQALRWRLEAAGGSIPALILAGPTSRAGWDALDLPVEAPNLDHELQLA